MARVWWVAEEGQGPRITFDACLTGGGATLHMAGNSTSTLDAWLAVGWTQLDHDTLKANREDPSFQADWEAYAMLLALWTWREQLAPCRGKLVLWGDALGVLQATIRRRARNPRINLILVEAQLVMGYLGGELAAAHWWSERNVVCDELSRLDQDGSIPAMLHGVPRTEVLHRKWRILGSDV